MTSSLPYDRLVALGAPSLPLGLSYRIKWFSEADGVLLVELREARALFGTDRLARRIVDTRTLEPANVAGAVATACRECVEERQARSEREILAATLLGTARPRAAA